MSFSAARRAQHLTLRRLALVPIVAALLAIGSASSVSGQPGSQRYEVWALDQADTDPAGGGLLYVWDGGELSRHAARATPQVIELAAAARDAGCEVARRPHMALTNHAQPASHVIVANVGSGDIHFVDVASWQIVGCVRTADGFAAAGGSLAAHAAMPTPDDSLVIVVDVGAAGESGFLHKIATDYAANSFELVETLPLAALGGDLGTALVKPICHEFTTDGRFAYVTLAGGGLAVVEVGSADGSTPMQVAHTYPAAIVPGAGCGALGLPDGRMLTNGESGPTGGDDFLYMFDTAGAAAGIFPDPVQIELPGDDTHGLEVCTDVRGDLFAWTAMRVSNHLNVVDLQTYEVVRSHALDRPWSQDPKPDLALLRDGTLFVSLRGPQPLTAINPLESPARTPGVASLRIHPNCQTFSWGPKDLAPMVHPETTVLADGSVVTIADPHGLVVVDR